MEFAKDSCQNRIAAVDANPKDAYFCPHCGGRLIVKNQGEIKRPHFAHRDTADCDSWAHPMSEWHFKMQEMFAPECREIICEKDGVSHRADVLKEGTVFEFQNSNLPEKEYIERNTFYNSLGLNVIWVFNVLDQASNGQITEAFKNELSFNWKWAKKMLRYTPDLNGTSFALFFWTGKGDYYRVHKVIRALKSSDGLYDFRTFKLSNRQYEISKDLNPTTLLSAESTNHLKPYKELNLKSKCPRDEIRIETFGGKYGCDNCAYCGMIEQNYAFNEEPVIYCCYPRVINENGNKDYHPYSPKSGNISFTKITDFDCETWEETGQTLLELLNNSESGKPFKVRCIINNKSFLITPLKAESNTYSRIYNRYPGFNSSELKENSEELYVGTANGLLYKLTNRKIWEPFDS